MTERKKKEVGQDRLQKRGHQIRQQNRCIQKRPPKLEAVKDRGCQTQKQRLPKIEVKQRLPKIEAAEIRQSETEPATSKYRVGRGAGGR